MRDHPPIAAPHGDTAPHKLLPKTDVLGLNALKKWRRQTLMALSLGIISDLAVFATQIESMEKAPFSAAVLFLGAFVFCIGATIFRCVAVFKLAQSLQISFTIIPTLLSTWVFLALAIGLFFNRKTQKILRKEGM